MKLLWFLFGLLVIVVAQISQRSRTDVAERTLRLSTLLIVVPWVPDLKTAFQVHDSIIQRAKWPDDLIILIGCKESSEDIPATLRLVLLNSKHTLVNRVTLMLHMIKKSSTVTSPYTKVFYVEFDPSLHFMDQFDKTIFDMHTDDTTVMALNVSDLPGAFSARQALRSTSTGIPDLTVLPWPKTLDEPNLMLETSWFDLRNFVCGPMYWSSFLRDLIMANYDRVQGLIYGDHLWISVGTTLAKEFKLIQRYNTDAETICKRSYWNWYRRTDWSNHPWITSQKFPAELLKSCHTWFYDTFKMYWSEASHKEDHN